MVCLQRSLPTTSLATNVVTTSHSTCALFTPPQHLIAELKEEQERLERDRVKKEKMRELMAQPRRMSSRLEVNNPKTPPYDTRSHTTP